MRYFQKYSYREHNHGTQTIIKKPNGNFVVTDKETVKATITNIFDKLEMTENRKR